MNLSKIEVVSLASLRAPARNVRHHPEKQIVELARAVKKFGQTRPVVIDENGVVLAGNGLVEACRRIDLTEVSAYRMVGLSAAQKSKLMLSDNRINALGLDDHDALLAVIRETEDLDFDIPGYDPDILETLRVDTAAVTAEALSGYGKLSEESIANARARDIPPGATARSETEEQQHQCPKCGLRFARP